MRMSHLLEAQVPQDARPGGGGGAGGKSQFSSPRCSGNSLPWKLTETNVCKISNNVLMVCM